MKVHLLPVTACLLTAATLSGCLSVGPNYERPELVTPDAWSRSVSESFTTNAPSIETWWELFGDDTLNGLIDQCSTNNLELRIAAERILEAAAIRGISRSEWYPQIDGVGAVTATRSSEAILPETLPEIGLEREQTRYTVGASLGWELDIWGRIRRLVESSDAGLQASIEDYRDTMVMLYAEVAHQYLQVRTYQERIRLAKENVSLQENTMKLTQDRNDAGLVPDLDVHQAQMNLAETQSLIPPLRTARAVAIHRLGVLMGDDPTALSKSLGVPAPIPETPKTATVGLPADLLRQRPDVRTAERELASQHALIGARKAEYYPTFTLPGTFTFDAFDASDLSGDALQYSFGPQFRWNLFAGGRVRSRVEAEASRTKQAESRYESVVLRALEDVENAMVSLIEDRARIEHLEQAAASAGESVRLVQSLYKSGLTDFQNVLNSERSLRGHQDRLADTSGMLAMDMVRLYKALGGGWRPDEDGTPVAPPEPGPAPRGDQ